MPLYMEVVAPACYGAPLGRHYSAHEAFELLEMPLFKLPFSAIEDDEFPGFLELRPTSRIAQKEDILIHQLPCFHRLATLSRLAFTRWPQRPHAERAVKKDEPRRRRDDVF